MKTYRLSLPFAALLVTLALASPSFAESGSGLHVDTASRSGVVFSLATPEAEFMTLEWSVDVLSDVFKTGFSTPPDNSPHQYWFDFTKLESGRWANRWKGFLVHAAVRQYLKGRAVSVKDLRFVSGTPDLPPDPGLVSVRPEEAIPRAGRPFPLEIVVRNYGTRPVTGIRLSVDGLPDGVRLAKEDELAPSGVIPACAGFDSVGGDMGPALPNERRFRLTLTDPGVADFTACVRLEADGDIVRKANVRVKTLPSLQLDRVAYPPEPKPVSTKPYEIGAFLFPGWDTHRWHGIWSRAAERKPLLGWYDERNPEVVDWQIKHLVENGISFVYVDWYWNAGHQWHNHWMDVFPRTRYRKYLKWAVMWANHNGKGSHSLADQEKVTRYWIDRFFCQDEYLTVGGMPVVTIWSPFGMAWDMREEGGCRALLDLSRRLAREAGYKGVWFVAVRTPDGRTDREWLRKYEDMGFDATCVYKYYGQGAAGRPDVNGVRPFRWIAETSGDHWRKVRQNSRLPFLPSLSTGYDPRPWRVEYKDVIGGYDVCDFRRICREAKSFSDETGVRTLMVGPMDEWGEGSIGYPNAQFGFGILESVRDTFGIGPRECWPCNYAPEDVGLGPYPTPDAALSGSFVVDGTQSHTVDLGAQTVGGYAVFDVLSKVGDPVLTVEYACHPNGLTGKGDFQRETSARYLGERFDLPVLPGNVNRHEIYRIGRTGRFVAPLIQGQERYARFHVEPKDASVTIANFAITNAEVFAAEPLAGSFRCSDERLNRLWDASVWTCRLASFPNHDAWKNAGGRLMPRKLEKGDSEGWCKTFAPDDGTLEVVYEFDANPHFPVGKFDVLTGNRRATVVQDGTNVLKTLKLPVRAGERFGFAVEKESWPMIDSVVVRNFDGKVVFRDDFDGSLDNWTFTRTRAYVADGAKRDRLVWSGDLWWAERNLFHAFAPSVPYIRDSILMLADNQTPEGYVQACPFPENHRPLKSLELGPWESDEFAAWLVPVAWDYLLYTGDAKTLREAYPAICRLMDYLMANRESDGLFKMRLGYSKSIGGERLGSSEHTTYMNLLLWMCYRDAAAIADELGMPEAAKWRDEQKSLARTIRAKLWDRSSRHFKSSLEQPRFRVLSNAFAFAIGFLTAEEANALAPRLTRFGVGKILALILRGKFEYGYGTSAIKTFDGSNWLKVLEDSWPGAHCTTECMFMMTKSWWDESHPDTAMAGQLSDYVLGVRPTSPGYRTWTFDPRPGNLTYAEGRVPTPRGVIEVRWERVGSRLKCRVKEPGAAERNFEIDVPKEPDLSESDSLKEGVLEVFDSFSDTSVTSNAYSELEFDIGKVTGIRQICLTPTDNNVGWPGNLKVEVSDRPGRWTLVRQFETLPRQETVVDLSTVVGATRGRYIRLSATKLGPAWLVNNFNLQFGKVKILFE